MPVSCSFLRDHGEMRRPVQPAPRGCGRAWGRAMTLAERRGRTLLIKHMPECTDER